MYAMVTFFEDSPADLDHGIEHVLDEVVPTMQQAKGLNGVWLVDRDSGKRISVMVWADEDEATAAMERMAAVRAANPDRVRPAPTSWGRYEVYASVQT